MKKLLIFLTFVFMVLTACDEGRIYEKTITVERGGRVVKLNGTFSGIKNWTDDYSVVVAGFSDDSEYAMVTKSLPINKEEGGEVELVLSGISDDVTSLKLCVINRLRECIVSFKTIEDDELAVGTDTIRMDVGTLDVGMYSAIQTQVFNNKCTACHGNTGSAAAGLFLTQDKSHNALVNHTAHVNSSMLLVSPGNVEESFLHFVLNRDGDTNMHHMDMFSANEQAMLTLIDKWIDGGAFLSKQQ